MEKSEREKMLADEPYLADDPELVAMTAKARMLLHSFNTLSPNEVEARQEILRSLLGGMGTNVEIRSPFFCDYGCHILMGDHVFINFDCVILDCNFVHIGNNVMMAPKVQIYTAYHPVEPAIRQSGLEMAAAIAIQDNVWLGGGVIICPGVTIGENTTIGVGSVVTKNIPANVVAAGNPCRVLRQV